VSDVDGLDPRSILEADLPLAFRGYRVEDVDAFLGEIALQVGAMGAQLEALRSEVVRLRTDPSARRASPRPAEPAPAPEVVPDRRVDAAEPAPASEVVPDRRVDTAAAVPAPPVAPAADGPAGAATVAAVPPSPVLPAMRSSASAPMVAGPVQSLAAGTGSPSGEPTLTRRPSTAMAATSASPTPSVPARPVSTVRSRPAVAPTVVETDFTDVIGPVDGDVPTAAAHVGAMDVGPQTRPEPSSSTDVEPHAASAPAVVPSPRDTVRMPTLPPDTVRTADLAPVTIELPRAAVTSPVGTDTEVRSGEAPSLGGRPLADVAGAATAPPVTSPRPDPDPTDRGSSVERADGTRRPTSDAAEPTPVVPVPAVPLTIAPPPLDIPQAFVSSVVTVPIIDAPAPARRWTAHVDDVDAVESTAQEPSVADASPAPSARWPGGGPDPAGFDAPHASPLMASASSPALDDASGIGAPESPLSERPAVVLGTGSAARRRALFPSIVLTASAALTLVYGVIADQVAAVQVAVVGSALALTGVVATVWITRDRVTS
jgi:DivIVA domain-containing protein